MPIRLNARALSIRYSLPVALAFAGCTALVAQGGQTQSSTPQTSSAPAQQGPPASPAAAAARAAADGPVRDASGAIIGFTNLAEIPGTPWRIHDAARPHPRGVTPGGAAGAPPADAVVLFDGKDLAKWGQVQNGQVVDSKWPVHDGYFETGAGSGSMVTREKFGDVQLHVEFATPSPGRGASQDRGNSGVIFMGRYEIQVLDSFENVTYADGQAAAIYGEYPPLVNAARKPGEWQTYDIIFEGPRWDENGKNTRKASATVLHNGVMIHNKTEFFGPTNHRNFGNYDKPGRTKGPIELYEHGNPVRFRNIWIREVKGYDAGATDKPAQAADAGSK
jgi:hypothetical protein